MGDEESVTKFNGGDGPNAGKWASRVSDELNDLPRILSVECKRWEKQSIYRIPHSIKELCRSAYQPQTVSIGPYHHGEPHLEAMEEHKHRALLTFLHRSKKSLHWYVDALAPVAEDLKNAYQGLDPKWEQDSEAFLQLMIVDGCFVLEIMRSTTAKPEALSRMGYQHNDPLFSSHGTHSFFPYVYMLDMLKLENQLPLLLLVELLLAEDGSLAVDGLSKQGELISLILKYIGSWEEKNIENYYVASLYILDIYRESLVLRLPLKKKKFRKKRPKVRDYYILAAMKLSDRTFFHPSRWIKEDEDRIK